MKDFRRLYENAKNRANRLMVTGQISAYIDALKEVNQYKKMMLVVIAN